MPEADRLQVLDADDIAGRPELTTSFTAAVYGVYRST